ncbi:hypothetical protein H4V95_001236 [Arthrobacter sp. CAN_C5]|nr:hypothetical protein [Arthrobacter sp. CAN_C5]
MTTSPHSGGQDEYLSPEIKDVVCKLSHLLTPRIVAGLSGHQDPDLVREWGDGTSVPPDSADTRLRFAHEVLSSIQRARHASIAQSWAITVNPRLGYTTPVKAIREDRFVAAASAAKALLDEAYEG